MQWHSQYHNIKHTTKAAGDELQCDGYDHFNSQDKGIFVPNTITASGLLRHSKVVRHLGTGASM
jgi:predicted deacetylase